MRRSVRSLVVLPLLLGACGGGATGTQAPGASPPAEPVGLTVLAAASLRNALERVAAGYEATQDAAILTIATDSSAALEAQIEQGAPADVFLSADVANPQKLVDAGLVAGPAVAFASNELAVIVPAGNPAGIETPADLARPGVRIIAATDAVPITRYAHQLTEHLALEPGYPAGFAVACAANVVSREANVSAIVAKIELGEGDAAIVYATDAHASAKVSTVEVPAAANVRATYAGVALRGSPNRAAASGFLAWLAGPDGQAILGTFGFLPPS